MPVNFCKTEAIFHPFKIIVLFKLGFLHPYHKVEDESLKYGQSLKGTRNKNGPRPKFNLDRGAELIIMMVYR